ncbi:MAG: FtsQ-type POTRA domain-containing protein [Melioribacter sp.]|uniref:cell division protein FtsQ/DivIB n=1 Tax=Rosettibacter primus TaxID=3111523 RepID=UPI00247E1B99|nr:FtsQ-type POTRA domain-containing protein [Melioribacter sp.]
MKNLLSVILFVLLIGIIFYIGLMQNEKTKILIDAITIYGNNHLSKEDYMRFANLIDKNSYRNLSLRIIKDRIEKHPYVDYADVKYEGSGKVIIKIYEKNFSSILIDNQNQFILTEEMELLPFLPDTKNVDYPIISNIFKKDSLRVLKSLRKNYDVLTASKILSGIKYLNEELYNELSLIDMNKGADIMLYFSSLDYPVLIGRGSEIKKIVYFNNLWNYLKGKEINNYMNYIDLRYNEHIYFGIQDSLQAGEKKL